MFIAVIKFVEKSVTSSQCRPIHLLKDGPTINFMVLTSWLKIIAWVHPVHAMNAEQRQTTADLWVKPTEYGRHPSQ